MFARRRLMAKSDVFESRNSSCKIIQLPKQFFYGQQQSKVYLNAFNVDSNHNDAQLRAVLKKYPLYIDQSTLNT